MMDRTADQGRSGRNGFAGLDLVRHGERRGDAEWLAGAAADPTARFIPVWGTRTLAAGDPPRAVGVRREQLGPTLAEAEETVFLGTERGAPRFALGYTGDEPPGALAGLGRFSDLRRAAPLLPGPDAALLAYARAMITWHRTARFCGHCGAPTASVEGGFARRCTGAACGAEVFPRTDPAVIVAVVRRGRVLLGRQAWWEPGRYSVIAGFVEPGETFEAAVAREVAEETGVAVDRVRYRSSQPWPFPGSIMVGFSARGLGSPIERRDGELEDARWVSREELARALECGTLGLPYRVSIAYRLIEEWFDSVPGWRLRDLDAG